MQIKFAHSNKFTYLCHMEKQWYRISDTVEYSTDFTFFMTNQINVVKSNNMYKFNSRLESKCFGIKHAIFGNYCLTDEQIQEAIKEIHTDILNGKHGLGTLTN